MAKTYFSVTGAIFLVITFLHLSRIIWSWQVVMGGWVVPMWVSWIGIAAAGFLAFQGIKLSKK